MRIVEVFYKEVLAGTLREDDLGYHFEYDDDYIHKEGAAPISLTLPLKQKDFHRQTLFPFFDGLIPEGWLLNIAENNWKLNHRDRMGLLSACCKDCIGAVSVRPVEAANGE